MYKEIADISGSTRSNLLVSLKISSDLEVNGNSKFSILESSKIILRSFSRFLIGADEFSYLFFAKYGTFLSTISHHFQIHLQAIKPQLQQQ